MVKFVDLLLTRIKPNCAVWEITLKCNSRCIHCGSDAGLARSAELSTNEALRLVKDLKSCGYKGVALMGGEPLLRDDWYDIAKEVKNQKMQLSIITNGLNLDKYIQEVKELKTDCISLSLDGGKAETHDYLRGIRGSFDKTIKLIHLLRKEHLPVSVITSVSKINFKEINMIKKTLTDMNVAWQIQLAVPIGRFRKELVISREEYYTLALFIAINHKKYSYRRLPLIGAHCFGYFSRFIPNLGLNPWIGCQAGHSVLGIQSNGNIKGCLTLPDEFIEGNIRKESLNNILKRLKIKRYPLRNFCQQCDISDDCKGGCTGTSLAFKSFKNPYCLRAIENGFLNHNPMPINRRIDSTLSKLNNIFNL